MWQLTILALLISVSGYYATADQRNLASAQQTQQARLADSMGIYRQAVTAYFSANPDQLNGSVGLETLRQAGFLPGWSPLLQQPTGVQWTNYRGNDGTIMIYATLAMPENVATDIAALSDNSILAGMYRSGDTTLYSLIYGDTGIPLPLPPGASIPAGSPLWLSAVN